MPCAAQSAFSAAFPCFQILCSGGWWRYGLYGHPGQGRLCNAMCNSDVARIEWIVAPSTGYLLTRTRTRRRTCRAGAGRGRGWGRGSRAWRSGRGSRPGTGARPPAGTPRAWAARTAAAAVLNTGGWLTVSFLIRTGILVTGYRCVSNTSCSHVSSPSMLMGGAEEVMGW